MREALRKPSVRRRGWWRPLSLALSLLTAGMGLHPALAQWLGPEFQVNTYTTLDQWGPAVAADGSGNFVVVWQSNDQNDASWGVFGQRFSSAGAPIGSEFHINSYTTEYQALPAVAANGAGNFVVVWESYRQDGSGMGIFGQRFNSAGSRVGAEFQVNSYTTTFQRNPAVAADASGNFVVVWESYGQDGSGFGLFAQRYDSAGGALGSEFQVNTYTTNYQIEAAVAADGTGKFVVVWSSYRQDGSMNGVFGQRFAALGNPVGGEFQVNRNATGGQRAPAVAADSAGNFVVVWSSYEQDYFVRDLFGQRFNSSGNALGREFHVNRSSPGDESPAAVAEDGAGNFVVVWASYVQYDSRTELFGQRFNATGSRVEGEFPINSYTTNWQRYSVVTANGRGDFVVAWSSQAQDGSEYGAFGRQIATGVFFDGFELGDACAWSTAVGGGCP